MLIGTNFLIHGITVYAMFGLISDVDIVVDLCMAKITKENH